MSRSRAKRRLAAEIDRLHRVIGGGAAPLPRRDG